MHWSILAAALWEVGMISATGAAVLKITRHMQLIPHTVLYCH